MSENVKKILTPNDFESLYNARKQEDLGLLNYCEKNNISIEDTLKHYGLNDMIGKNVVDKFYATSDAGTSVRRIFAEFIRDNILNAMEKQTVWKKLIAGSVNVPSQTTEITWVDEPTVNEVDGAKADELTGVAEGTLIPTAKLTYGSKQVKLTKKARAIELSYETIEQMLLDLLAIHLNRIGYKLDLQRDAQLVSVLINGNKVDKSDGASVIQTADAATAISRTELVKANLSLRTKGYEPKYAVMNQFMAEDILNLPEFKDALLFDFAKTGNLPTIMGSEILITDTMPDQSILFVDPRFSAEHLTFRAFDVESDKIINRQIEETVASVIDGFASLYNNARVLVKRGA